MKEEVFNEPAQDVDFAPYIYNDTTYLLDGTVSVRIQNSYPKGGAPMDRDGVQGYTDNEGRMYGYVLFWTRVMNTSVKAIKLEISFPPIPSHLFHNPSSFARLLLPSAPVDLNRVDDYNYGITGMRSFLNEHWDTESGLEISLAPGEEHTFFVTALSYKAGGRVRSKLLLEDPGILNYWIEISPHGGGTINCGRISVVD
ncbi:MAG: hypothetical protein AAFQ02_11690 [Bacteroidota bacterium]